LLSLEVVLKDCDDVPFRTTGLSLPGVLIVVLVFIVFVIYFLVGVGEDILFFNWKVCVEPL
jgi:hypothetical protein